MTKIISDIQSALDILGLPPLVTKSDIKRQYHHLAKRYHPDLGSDSEKMEMINSSYRLLMDYIEQFRYSFNEEEISRQFPGADYAKRFRF
jgi:DnaJ-class molecular chaperone